LFQKSEKHYLHVDSVVKNKEHQGELPGVSLSTVSGGISDGKNAIVH